MPSGHGGLRSCVFQRMASDRVLRGNGIKFVAVEVWIEKCAVWMKCEHVHKSKIMLNRGPAISHSTRHSPVSHHRDLIALLCYHTHTKI